jgi:hypothetical protein
MCNANAVRLSGLGKDVDISIRPEQLAQMAKRLPADSPALSMLEYLQARTSTDMDIDMS